MLQVSIWTRLITLIIVLGGILVALPNALSPDMAAPRMPKFLPNSAASIWGLDLQGGSYLLLAVDFDQVDDATAPRTLIGDILRRLPQGPYPATTDLNARGDTAVSVCG